VTQLSVPRAGKEESTNHIPDVIVLVAIAVYIVIKRNVCIITNARREVSFVYMKNGVAASCLNFLKSYFKNSGCRATVSNFTAASRNTSSFFQTNTGTKIYVEVFAQIRLIQWIVDFTLPVDCAR